MTSPMPASRVLVDRRRPARAQRVYVLLLVVTVLMCTWLTLSAAILALLTGGRR